MSFLSREAIDKLGFKRVGKNVKISDKASIYDHEKIEIGDNSRIDDFCVVSGSVKIGRFVHFAVFNNVAGGDPGIEFEDFSGLAYGCHVFAQSDDYSGCSMTNPTVPDMYKREAKAPILIKRHSIVGTGSVITPGVTLATGTAVGALSLVTKSTDPWSVYFGSPAKRIKARKQDVVIMEQAMYLEANSILNV
jgi:acetyltransferase-like isoleucine patch superfamily enzyme